MKIKFRIDMWWQCSNALPFSTVLYLIPPHQRWGRSEDKCVVLRTGERHLRRWNCCKEAEAGGWGRGRQHTHNLQTKETNTAINDGNDGLVRWLPELLVIQTATAAEAAAAKKTFKCHLYYSKRWHLYPFLALNELCSRDSAQPTSGMREISATSKKWKPSPGRYNNTQHRTTATTRYREKL